MILANQSVYAYKAACHLLLISLCVFCNYICKYYKTRMFLDCTESGAYL